MFSVLFMYRIAGLICLLLGVVGYVLPVMPGTVFIIAAAYCFARGSPKLDRWIRSHSHFGPVIENWEAHHAIPYRAKLIALSSMTISTVVILCTLPSLIGKIAASSVLALCALYVGTRPSE